MKTITGRPSFQGDLCIYRVVSIPDNVTPATPENGAYVVAHSETGHHHIVKERGAQLLIDKTNAFIAYLDVAEPTTLEHLRSFDTHETLLLPPGLYKVHRQRQATPEGWERAAD